MTENEMPPMVLRVARILCGFGDSCCMNTNGDCHYEADAREVIQALRNPPEHVADALHHVPGGFGLGAWEVGIDAALGET